MYIIEVDYDNQSVKFTDKDTAYTETFGADPNKYEFISVEEENDRLIVSIYNEIDTITLASLPLTNAVVKYIGFELVEKIDDEDEDEDKDDSNDWKQ